jgi:integrase
VQRSELCALRWEQVSFEPGKEVVEIREALYRADDGQWRVKDTKTHQQRRIVPDHETAVMLAESHERKKAEAAVLGLVLSSKAYVCSTTPDGLTPFNPDTATQRYGRMAKRLGIDSELKHLRHYNATELIAGGVDPRTGWLLLASRRSARRDFKVVRSSRGQRRIGRIANRFCEPLISGPVQAVATDRLAAGIRANRRDRDVVVLAGFPDDRVVIVGASA